MTARRRASSWVAFALLAGCGGDAATLGSATPPRAGRFGSLRDFVLIERIEGGLPAPLFVDRFEVTRGDWTGFAATPEGRAAGAQVATYDGDPALPVGHVDLELARAFAHWRFARLPRVDEWQAAIGDGRHRFPWGSKEDPTRANTGELGLGEPVPVGTFEAGRRAGGNQPYDLVGNVSEWTETVSAGWTASLLDPTASFLAGRTRVLRTPALAVWQGPAATVPLAWSAVAGGRRVPHDAVGADFLTSMSAIVEAVPAGDRRLRLGLRLYATPRELLAALLATDAEPSADDLAQVRRFVRRDQHLPALQAAWPAVAVAYSAGRPLHRLLHDELRR